MSVDLAVDAPAVTPGGRFTVTVWLRDGTDSPVDGAQVFLDFDPLAFQVIGMQGGALLPVELHSAVDNHLGRIGYAAGTLGQPATAPFWLVSVEFQAMAATGRAGSTVACASPTRPHMTRTVYRGNDNTGMLGGPAVIVVAATTSPLETGFLRQAGKSFRGRRNG